MTENSKIPPAKKTIQDPPEYAAVNKLKGHEDQATYQQNGQQAVKPSEADMRYNPRYSEAAASSNPKDERDGREGTGNVSGNVSGDWLGGPQNGAEAPGSKESGPTGSGKAQGEGARNPQTGERIARNPQTGE
ncbi:hypothetical protein HFN87_16350 [Rhizobium laguerreae]|uniref:hypothetical protein n=1 Tax=Rhizobium laguerreae TaxID=1076926 RepID=UPI001C905210|nr:hypothetical protein [Rhizobium laguerreae]MBY3414849.1 hypothetical protein [Rhizobium laguerreae]